MIERERMRDQKIRERLDQLRLMPLVPCPHCKCTEVYPVYWNAEEMYGIRCPGCGARGPMKSRGEDSVKAWNGER